MQSVTGFASGLIIIPLMLWAGHGIPEAQAALLIATIPQNILGVYRFRNTIDYQVLKIPMVLRLLSLPLGIATLRLVDDFPVTAARQLVGLVVIGCVILLTYSKPKGGSTVSLPWTLLAFSTSGFFAGLTGTGGPMMVLWVQAHDWSTERSRGFLFAMYLTSLPFILGLLYLAFPHRILQASVSVIILLPALILVTQIGLRVGTQLGQQRLRRLTMGLLVLLGVVSILSPLL